MSLGRPRTSPAEAAPSADAGLPAADIVDLPAERLDRIMGWDLAYGVSLVADWLTRNARTKDMPSERIALLCDKLLALGLPLDRYGSSTEVLDAEHDSVSRLWVRGQGVTTRTYVRARDDDAAYRRSPFYEAAWTGRAVELRLARHDPSRFGIVAELQAEGYTHYLCVPIAADERRARLGDLRHASMPAASRCPRSRPWRGCCPPSPS